MTTTLDDIDTFFVQQTTRVRDQLATGARTEFFGRGTDPARLEGDDEALIRRAYTRRETTPIPHRRNRWSRRRGE